MNRRQSWPAPNSAAASLCSPTLAHEAQQVRQGFGMGLVPLGGKLMRPLVELSGHLGCFARRTADGNERLRQHLKISVHKS